MNDLNVLFIAGNWTKDGGRSSKYMGKLINSIENKLSHPIKSFNGGNSDNLEDILKENAKDADVVFWFANIPPDENRRLNPKDFNHHVILVNYKRNDNNKYSFDDLISISLSLRSDLTCEVYKDDTGRYNMRVFDVFGTMWSDFSTNTSKSVAEILSRVSSLKSLNYSRLIKASNENIKIQNPDIDDIRSTFDEFGKKLKELSPKNDHIRRHLGVVSFRGYIDPLNRSNDINYSSSRNSGLMEDPKDYKFVATKLLSGKVTYYGQDKPHLDSPVYDKLLSKLPEVKYMFGSSMYIDDASFTERVLPSGCLQNVDEIMKVIGSKQYTSNFCINLLGRGSIIFADTLEYVRSKFDNLQVRELPEPVGLNFDVVEVDDGVSSFICTLNNRPLENGETIEVKFDDGSIGTYDCIIRYYTDEDGKVHKDAYVPLVIKGVETEFPIVGNYARRI